MKTRYLEQSIQEVHQGRLWSLRVIHFAVKMLQYSSSEHHSFLQLLLPGSRQDLHGCSQCWRV